MCQNIELSQKGQVLISQCTECKMITVWQQNLLLSFTPEQFLAFRRFTEHLDVRESLFLFPDGGERLILRTPNSDINFSFSVPEWDNFTEALNEAAYMQSIFGLLAV